MTKRKLHRAGMVAASAVGLSLICAVLASAQRQATDDDPNGVVPPYHRVRLAHSADAGLKGTTAYLRAYDPYLFYQLGRDLVNRQFTLAEGAYGRSGEMSVPLYVGGEVKKSGGGTDVRFARDHANSCTACHSIPFRDPGGGQTIASTSGLGRNTPHFYGAGLVEMLGEQIRAEILARYDGNHNGVIDRAEVRQASPVRVAPAPGAPAVDYGDLSPGADGIPRLNSLFHVWYVGGAGNVIPTERGLNDPRVAAFGLAPQPFGWGRGRHAGAAEGGEASTLRGIYALAADVHMGLQAFDPSQQLEAGTGVGGEVGVSLNGARQYDFGGAADRGRRRSFKGLSLDDPDGDGVVSELTEGDVDAAEFYMLHAPAPAVRATATSEQGRAVLQSIGCVRCHVENWRLEARDERLGFTGDRRFFRLSTRTANDDRGVPQLVGALVPLYRRLADGAYAPRGGAFLVERIYTDFKHWDIGPGFYERRYDGSLQREHRTAPLWGVGGTAPYGHSGQYGTLDEVIAAHGGEAAAARRAYTSLSPARRRLLVQYLESLVLYPTDSIPVDLDGDGAASMRFTVAGQPVGFERFDARFLFAVPPRYKHLYDVEDVSGRVTPLMLIVNVAETYGLNQPYRIDANDDGFPDVLEPLGSKSAENGH